jgi:hypothetical protein
MTNDHIRGENKRRSQCILPELLSVSDSRSDRPLICWTKYLVKTAAVKIKTGDFARVPAWTATGRSLPVATFG